VFINLTNGKYSTNISLQEQREIDEDIKNNFTSWDNKLFLKLLNFCCFRIRKKKYANHQK
jgi:hypothetical protein